MSAAAHFCESKTGEPEKFLWLQHRDFWVLQGARRGLLEFFFRQHQLTLGRQQRGEEIETNQAKNNAIYIGDWYSGLNVPMSQVYVCSNEY
jgi:hypothetical protein